MISKAEAMKLARKLPGPPAPGVVLRGMRIEVACAWMGVLVLKRGIEPAPVIPHPLPLPLRAHVPIERASMGRGESEEEEE